MASFGTVLKVIGGGVAGAFFYHFFTHDNNNDQQINNGENISNINLRNSRNRITTSSSGSQSQLDYGTHNLIDLLQNTLIEYILCDETSHVITIDSQATLDYALMRMNESNVTSLPIVDLQHKKYIGMLSIIDICSFLGQFTNSDSPNTPVGDVLKYNREPFLPLYVNSPIQLLIHIMTHVPQVPIYASSSETIVVDIVSRLNVIKFIHENIEDLGLKSNASIKSLGLLSKQICSIDSDSRVIDAINLLNSEQVTEIAVINKEGKLIGTFSASDLRKLSIYTFNQCYEPINKFVKLDQDQLIVVSPSSSLSQTIKKFVENNAQICWIVDNQMKPISSITQLSLMKYFLNLSTSFIE
ncbi:hypothetical protein DICPUDRAFT_91572 [Dictyostelium purpureum]|uniref:CBS domain-containing protein n=1 Tax=Dictyostelium purpureum TaxID=5786 RepID=F0ZEA8_DICPU|nr:uncharacterized protein DICPUDRAFT_91572 [Dictyostelium purpureum]EGC37722.1 hypothetical protein DICPUDRAFT_91572 [Dictyostelium purpureum]|eukprot:XP_003285743.1 hypothetical protein DICPUDRAFT_91572 [Dictyostelium purpureum]